MIAVLLQVLEFIIVAGIATLAIIAFFLFEYYRHQHKMRQAAYDLERAKVTFERTKDFSARVATSHGANIEYGSEGTLKIITFFPSPVSHNNVKITEEAPQEQKLLPPPFHLPVAPPFSQIAHQIMPGRLILGYGMDGPLYGDITDLLSTAIVGRPGTGKTTMLRLICAEMLQVGGLPMLLDPHGSIVDELGDFIDCAETSSQITEITEWVAEELDERLSNRRQGLALKQPLLLLADEWPVISQLSPDALQPVRRLILEGRKVGMYALICGQGLPASLLGGTLVRDALASRYVFNTTAQQARLAGLDNDTAKTMLAQLDNAGPGKCILASSRRRPELVAIPSIDSQDLRLLVPGTCSSVPSVPLNVPQPVKPFPSFPASTEKRKGTLKISFEEREQIINLSKSGIPRREICTQLGKGKYYYETVKVVLDEYERVSREA